MAADGDRRQARIAAGAAGEDVAQPVDLDAAARLLRPVDEQVAHLLVLGRQRQPAQADIAEASDLRRAFEALPQSLGIDLQDIGGHGRLLASRRWISPRSVPVKTDNARRLRLHHHRRRLGRRGPGGAAERGSRHPRAAARSRPRLPHRRHAAAPAHPQSAARHRRRRLSLAQASGPPDGTAGAQAPVARPRDRRQLDHQRPDRHPRHPRGLRRLGRRWRHGLGLAGGPALLPQAGKRCRFRRRALSRQGGPDPRLSRARRAMGPCRPRPDEGGDGAGLRLVRRPQRAAGNRRLALRHQQPPGPAHLGQRRLPRSGARPRQPDDRRQRGGRHAHLRRQSPACQRRAGAGGWRTQIGAGAARGDPVGRRDPFAGDPAALRHRAAWRAGRPRHKGRGRAAGRRASARPSDPGPAARAA